VEALWRAVGNSTPPIERSEGAVSMRHMLLGAMMLAGVLPASSMANAQDATAGERVFRSQCSICHSPQPDRNIIGPSLFSVVGRHSGLISGFRYSAANKNSGLVWDVNTLDRYLAGPRQVVPGTLMTYPGLKDQHQRADLIAYLVTMH
jgi:cytochrome c2